MDVSVIIITKDEQPRLSLCLSSLARQSARWGDQAEVIVVDDGSEVPIGAGEVPAGPLVPIILRHERSQGRSASRNAGALRARGRRLLFLDGDVLLSPHSVVRHAELGPTVMGRGEQRHIRSTRFFRDPRTGEPWPGKEARVRSMGDPTPHLVTEEAVMNGPFERLLERSEVAIYPGAGPRRLYDLEMRALRGRSAPLAEWMAAAGHNFSVPRDPFLTVGGFDLAISINEHRDLALRLSRRGCRLEVVDDAVSIHLTHREGWRDPLAGEDGWERAFARSHPRETEVMVRFWRSLAGDPAVPPAGRLASLEEVDAELRASLERGGAEMSRERGER